MVIMLLASNGQRRVSAGSLWESFYFFGKKQQQTETRIRRSIRSLLEDDTHTVTGWSRGMMELGLLLTLLSWSLDCSWCPPHPEVCSVGELSGLFLSQGREQRENRGATSPKAPRLPPRALRFCFESTKTGIFYRIWNVTILPRKPENLTANVNLII